ncbi:hypothetical protein [Lysinibacillus sp. NPDC093216]|uniref:hypothetical protein n=1 Tax=Lysinibacillus sp. NPDC093216 TaxID=3390576 RepID=UPI003CFD1548
MSFVATGTGVQTSAGIEELSPNVTSCGNLSVRKQRDSNKCFLCESEATATGVFCAKAKRQQQVILCESEESATNVFCTKAKRPPINYAEA